MRSGRVGTPSGGGGARPGLGMRRMQGCCPLPCQGHPRADVSPLRCIVSPQHPGVLPPIPQQSRLCPSAVARWRGDGKHQSTAPVALQEGKSDANVNADLRERGFSPPPRRRRKAVPQVQEETQKSLVSAWRIW